MNFHLPLPESTYDQLKAAALLRQSRRVRHEADAAYATQMSGTKFDLDSDLESAGVEHLLKTCQRTK